MIPKKKRSEMLEYLIEKLRCSDSDMEPKTKSILPGYDSTYILIGNDGIILLVDQEYRGKSFKKFHEKARKYKRNVASIVYKDGKTFFRNAAEKKRFKKDYGLSLKNYSDEEIKRMIQFRPEESFLFYFQGFVQYYQPLSQGLVQEVISYDFRRVIFDYSHIDSSRQFRPENRASEKLFI